VAQRPVAVPHRAAAVSVFGERELNVSVRVGGPDAVLRGCLEVLLGSVVGVTSQVNLVFEDKRSAVDVRQQSSFFRRPFRGGRLPHRSR
jgi:hypothetical protein